MPNVDLTLRSIAQWKYIISSDLTCAFYQIPLSKFSMKYCGVATSFCGFRVYVQCTMGMPGPETALEELVCWILCDCIQDRIDAKLADDLYMYCMETLLINYSEIGKESLNHFRDAI